MDFVDWSEVMSEVHNVHVRPQPNQMGKAGEQGCKSWKREESKYFQPQIVLFTGSCSPSSFALYKPQDC